MRSSDWSSDVCSSDLGLAAEGSTLPDAVMTAIPRADGVVLGPVSHYSHPAGQSNPSAAQRTGFNLYANVRPCRSRPGLSLLLEPMDLVIVSENTEGIYADRSTYIGPGEAKPDPDSAFSTRKNPTPAVPRVGTPACQY